MIVIYIDYNGSDRHWYYYHYDSGNHRVMTEGFENHIKAEEHAKESLGKDIEIRYKDGGN